MTLFITSCQPNVYKQGEDLYINNCSQCHGLDGAGLNQLIPPVANADFYTKNKGKIACIIRYGMKDSIVVNGISFQENMDGIPHLSGVEICNIINYMDNAFYNNTKITILKEITNSLNNCDK